MRHRLVGQVAPAIQLTNASGRIVDHGARAASSDRAQVIGDTGGRVSEYSPLMHEDEEATHVKLMALFASGAEPAVAEHGGRIVKNTGDGFLAEFPSAVEPVGQRCNSKRSTPP